MCYVTATELKNNLSFYLEKANEEDVYVTKNKRVICILTNPEYKAFLDAVSFVEGLEIPERPKDENGNILSDDDIVGEEIMKKCGF